MQRSYTKVKPKGPRQRLKGGVVCCLLLEVDCFHQFFFSIISILRSFTLQQPFIIICTICKIVCIIGQATQHQVSPRLYSLSPLRSCQPLLAQDHNQDMTHRDKDGRTANARARLGLLSNLSLHAATSLTCNGCHEEGEFENDTMSTPALMVSSRLQERMSGMVQDYRRGLATRDGAHRRHQSKIMIRNPRISLRPCFLVLLWPSGI